MSKQNIAMFENAMKAFTAFTAQNKNRIRTLKSKLSQKNSQQPRKGLFYYEVTSYFLSHNRSIDGKPCTKP